MRVYPRERGGTQVLAFAARGGRGLSPRTRGNPPLPGSPRSGSGSIPANAGEPRGPGGASSARWVYPRERGGTLEKMVGGGAEGGLSPRTRGNLLAVQKRHAVQGSIPANAGEPSRKWSAVEPKGVYPRERGGTSSPSRSGTPYRGLSPRTRGNPKRQQARAADSGSIPANAGEPRRSRWPNCRSGVYPRERGGTAGEHRRHFHGQGLSPRTRGNHLVRLAVGRWGGSIPANAGEPASASVPLRKTRVYPRERGGTVTPSAASTAVVGLSPRTRGNPSTVRPRTPQRGLSPRTRGNHPLGRPDRPRHGSIPANAGEPTAAIWAGSQGRVYPRERGGTRYRHAIDFLAVGLSPRTRGNPDLGLDQPDGIGSIPANAGEPSGRLQTVAASRVYPRERGGTSPDSATSQPAPGLSPRTRGNLADARGLGAPLGSIPANAGEPSQLRIEMPGTTVYPRERGGTARTAPRGVFELGLSPRTRGNPTSTRT